MSRQQTLDTLDFDGSASADDVKAAYRGQIKKTHPGSKAGDEEAFKRVSCACECLTE